MKKNKLILLIVFQNINIKTYSVEWKCNAEFDNDEEKSLKDFKRIYTGSSTNWISEKSEFSKKKIVW